jgi:hypothetical protein
MKATETLPQASPISNGVNEKMSSLSSYYEVTLFCHIPSYADMTCDCVESAALAADGSTTLL